MSERQIIYHKLKEDLKQAKLTKFGLKKTVEDVYQLLIGGKKEQVLGYLQFFLWGLIEEEKIGIIASELLEIDVRRNVV